MWDFLKCLGIVLLLGAILFGILITPGRQQDQIKSWCAERDYEVISCRSSWFSTGPFYFVDTDYETVYKVNARNKRSNSSKVFWFKFGAFGMDWKEG